MHGRDKRPTCHHVVPSAKARTTKRPTSYQRSHTKARNGKPHITKMAILAISRALPHINQETLKLRFLESKIKTANTQVEFMQIAATLNHATDEETIPLRRSQKLSASTPACL
jgi:hypothetical protein